MAMSPTQQAAVDCESNLVLFAGPGSGKTSTSIEKVHKTLTDPTATQLMTTFTKESALEMRKRLDDRVQQQGLPRIPEQRLRISTFDSLTLWHLRNVNPGKVNLLSPAAQSPRLRQLCIELGIGKLDEHALWFDAYQNALNRDQVIERITAESPQSMHLIEAYYDWLKAANLMDLATVKRTVAVRMQQGIIPLFPFKHMLVDEFQDCDELQILISIIHGQNGVTTTVVGDDDQTIYGWRSAIGYRGMIQFKTECKAQVVRLAENFRSKAEIVDHASQLIRFNNPHRVEKNQVAVKGEGGAVISSCQSDISMQAAWIVAHIKQNLKAPYDAAILCRTNIGLDPIEAKLRAHGLPFHRQGQSMWDRDDVQAFLAFMHYSTSGGAALLSQSLGYLGFERNTVNAIAAHLTGKSKHLRSMTSTAIETSNPQEAEVLANVIECLKKWRGNLDKEGAIDLVIQENIQMFAIWYSQLAATAKADGKEHPKVTKMKGILEVVEKVLLQIKGTLSARVRFLKESKSVAPEPGVIRLMTMHGSKGLEWNNVYIINADEREDDNSLIEGPPERRVFFVAMTRARNTLGITYSGKHPLFVQEAGIMHRDVITANAVEPEAITVED